MKQIKFTEQGAVLVEKLEVSNIEMPSQSDEALFNAFKETLLFAIKKRMNHCMSDLEENTSRIITSNTSSVIYMREDKTINQFNHPSYVCMKEAIPLIENNQYSDLKANQWEQIVKALYWVKPLNKDGYTFAQLVSWCIDNLCSTLSDLVTK